MERVFANYLVLFAALISASSSATVQSTPKPNIVFVLADDYGYNDIGYHGDQIKTPVLDRLAASGVKLENYYVQPICTPTRSQLLSGRYQIHTGLQHSIIVNSQANALPLDSPTIADKLKESGYATHMAGKWHVGFYKEEFMPQNRGFDTYYGYLGGHDTYYTHTNNFTTKAYLDWRDETGPVFNESGLYSAQLLTNRAIQVVRGHNPDKHPLFLYLAYQSVHNPLQVPERYEKQYKHIKDENRRLYAGMVAALDEGVGNLTAALKETGLWDNTVFILSTDNGGTVLYGGNNYPLRGWKGRDARRGLRGRRSGGPTVSSGCGRLAGGSLNGTKDLDGFDQWDTIIKGNKSPRKVMLHNIDILYTPSGQPLEKYVHIWDTSVRAALRMGDYKIITGDPRNGSWVPPPDGRHYDLPEIKDDPDKNLWLFNIKGDPYEHHDLSKKEPEVVEVMLRMLKAMNETAVPPHFPPRDPQSNPALHGGVWGPWQ
ncbi:hypothetical protein RRG08_056709 [Elysia crispata]|uniref:Sulfatase N-terminal domain-containing protein n=1 Tax=Elysia crispata TaxID=231223 RepID=A0AAE1AVH2_9GAST|nr:hypothetical protein RRG08_056709 [Elysia crispata]